MGPTEGLDLSQTVEDGLYVHWSRLGAEWEGEMTKSWWKSMSVSGVPIKSSRSMEISTRFCSQCGKLFTHVLLIFFSALELVYTCICILLGFASSLYMIYRYPI